MAGFVSRVCVSVVTQDPVPARHALLQAWSKFTEGGTSDTMRQFLVAEGDLYSPW